MKAPALPDDPIEAMRIFLRVRGPMDGPCPKPRVFRAMLQTSAWRNWMGGVATLGDDT